MIIFLHLYESQRNHNCEIVHGTKTTGLANKCCGYRSFNPETPDPDLNNIWSLDPKNGAALGKIKRKAKSRLNSPLKHVTAPISSLPPI